MTAALAGQKFYIADLITITLAQAIGGQPVLRYTTADQDLTSGLYTFKSAAPLFERSLLKWATGLEVDTLELTVLPKPTDYIGSISWLQALKLGILDNALVQIERAVMTTFGDTTPGTVVLFKGNVSDIAEIGRTHAKLRVKSRLELLNLGLPRKIYMPGCYWTLYDPGCTLTKGVAGISAPGAPSLSQVAGGSLSQQTYYVQTTYQIPIGNALLWSEALNNAVWTKEAGVTITTGQSDPLGGTAANNITSGTAGYTGVYQVSQINAASGWQATFSVWLKATAPTRVQLGISRSGALDTESVEVIATPAWKRFTFTHSSTWSGAGGVQAIIRPASPSTVVTAWGAQLDGGATTAADYVSRAANLVYGESIASTEASLTVSANNVLQVASPSTIAGVSAWNLYASTGSGKEQQRAAAVALGSNWTEPTSGLPSAGLNPPFGKATAVAAGSGPIIILTALSDADGYYDGGTVSFTSGPNAYVTAQVKKYLNASGQFTLTKALPFTPNLPGWATVATDNFQRGSLGANWTVNSGGFDLVSNQIRSNSATRGAVRWSANAFNADQFASLVIGAATGATADELGPAVRIDTGGADSHYDFFTRGTLDFVFLYKTVAGVRTFLTQLAMTINQGDTLRLEVQGNNLTGKVNGVTKLTATDSSLAAGAAGVAGVRGFADLLGSSFIGGHQVLGDAFTAYPGCDKQITTCDSKFNNKSNFGGFPYIPAPETAI